MQATRDALPQSYVWKWEEGALVDAILWAAASSATGRSGARKFLMPSAGNRLQRRRERGVQPVYGVLDHVVALLRAAVQSFRDQKQGPRVLLRDARGTQPHSACDRRGAHGWPGWHLHRKALHRASGDAV